MAYTLSRLLIAIYCISFFIACKKNNGKASSERVTDTAAMNDVVETDPPNLKAVTYHFNDAIGGFYEILPALYSQTNKLYPTLISLHGGGQLGNGSTDLPLLLNDGIPQLIGRKTFPPNFNINGKNFSYLILSPQFSRFPTNKEVQTFIDYVKKSYRVDPARFYLTGLSMGGIVTTDVASSNSTQFAAIVPMSGAISDSDVVQKCKTIADSKLPIWAFHNSDDPQVSSTGTVKFVSLVNSFEAEIPARLTIFQSSEHDAWTKAIDPGYKENNMNIYEWMLQYTR
jgi:predicted peptidase